MSFNSFVGDAFGEEGETPLFGKDILEERSIFPFEQLSEVPPSKSNNVSFMKIEELNKNCRNILAVSESYICYSVTQKRNVLRVIDTITGEKAILRSHDSAILDLKISPVDSATFCSVDNGSSATSHVVVWKAVNEKKVEFSPYATLPIPATIVVAHPSQSSIWAISDKRNLAVFSATRIQEDKPSSYDQLPSHATVDNESITGMVFTSDGKSLVCGINGAEENAYVQVWRIDGNDGIVRGVEQLHKVYNQYHNILRVNGLLTVDYVKSHIVTISRNDQCCFDNNDIAYEIKLWQHDSSLVTASSSPKFVQAVIVGVPAHQSKLRSPSSSLINPALEVASTIEPKNSKFLVLSSRKSNMVICFAINPSSKGLPIYHVTLLNLKAPVISFDVTTILGREHHSAEEGEHIELSCFQEEAADQASIQQYHILSNCLAEFSKYGQQPPSISLPAPSATAPVSASPVASTLPPLSTYSTPDIARPAESESTKAKSILSMLRNAAGPSTPAATVESIVAAEIPAAWSRDESDKSPISESKILSAISASNSPSPSPAGTNPFDFKPSVMTVDKAGLEGLSSSTVSSSSPAPEGMKKIDSKMLFGLKTASPAPVVAEKPVPANDLPDFLVAAAAPKSTSITDLLKRSVGSTTSTPVDTISSLIATPFPAPSAAVAPVTPSLAPHAPAPSSLPKPKLVEEKKAPIVNSSESKAPALQVPDVPLVSTTTAPVLSVPVAARSSDSDAQMLAMLASIQADLKALQSANKKKEEPQVKASDLSSLKEEILKEVRAQHTKIATQTAQAVKIHIDVENKKVMEALQASKQELTTHVTDLVNNKVLPIVTQKLKESTKDTIKETIKTTLAESFRNAFESSLLPAFQAGIDRLFAQVNVSFENGMKNFSDDVILFHQEHQRSYVDLEQEMQGLRDQVQNLEELVRDLNAKLQEGITLAAPIAAKEEVPPKPSPMELLMQGKIAEAMRCALEEKDIDQTVALLGKLSPQQVNVNCSNIIRLCITQQLAADMSFNMPQEGLAQRIQWIKNLVLSLVRIPASEIAADVVLSKNFKIMIQAVLESIQAGKKLIEKAQFDDGEENPIEIPHSVETDLQLLECVIQSKM